MIQKVNHAQFNSSLEVYAESGGLWNLGPDLSQVLIRVWRLLAKGSPVTPEDISQISDQLKIGIDTIEAYLQTVCERDENNNIVGCLGLSQKEHAHKFSVDGVQLWAWCAADTLFLPKMLGKTAHVESISPGRKEKITLTIHPHQIHEVTPDSAVVSFPLLDPENADISSPEAIWGSFCHRIYFFASQSEGEAWADEQANIAIVPVNEAFSFTMQLWEKVLAYV